MIPLKRDNRYMLESCLYCRCGAQAQNIHNEPKRSHAEAWNIRSGKLKCSRRYLKYLWQKRVGSLSSEMWRLLGYWAGTNASWESGASSFRVIQDVGVTCLLHYMQQPPLKRPSSASLHYCLSASVIFCPFTTEIYSWQYTETPGVSVFGLLPELADCTFYVTFGLADRGSMLHLIGIFVLWPNVSWQACLESCTKMYMKEISIKHVCRWWIEWQASTMKLISRRFRL